MIARLLPALLGYLLAPAENRTLAARAFVNGLAIVYGIAFASLAVQIEGLAGPAGILPVERFLAAAWAHDGYVAAWRIPTVFWLATSGPALRGAAFAGVVVSLVLLLGVTRPRPLLALLYVLYLSLYHAGQIFTQFQWDYLLLECGFLAIFLADTPTPLVVLLYEWLLFRLRFLSGYFKLASGDASWRDFTALDHYFETQPLPHVGSWYAHQLPQWLHATGVGFTFAAELLVPFFIFLPRPFRLVAAAVTILAQLLIIATSNHNFINLLTILLCLFLLDDDLLRRVLPSRWHASAGLDGAGHAGMVGRVMLVAIALFTLALSVTTFALVEARRGLPQPVYAFGRLATSWGIGNVFHLFPTMQTERQELEILGSRDGIGWARYEFRYKPDRIDEAPRFVAPHQPRLDWMMWFLPPQSRATGYWFDPFLEALRENRPAVTGLLARNPFAGGEPPRMLRVIAYRYRFTTPEERAASGEWWRADLLGDYPDVPPRRP